MSMRAGMLIAKEDDSDDSGLVNIWLSFLDYTLLALVDCRLLWLIENI